MTTNITLVVVVGVLVACGVTLLLERSLTRIAVGFVLIGNAINILFLIASGEPGAPPIIGSSSGPMSDPLPQAMALTAIVITLGVTAFGLALAYRAWQLTGHDDVQDDLEDDLVRRRAERDDTSSTFDHGADPGVPDEEGADPADLPADERSPGESDAATDGDLSSLASGAHDHSLEADDDGTGPA